MVFNNLNDLKNFIIGNVFPNSNFQTGSQDIQDNDIALAESLWNRSVANAVVGTADPIGNIISSFSGQLYFRTDTTPIEVYANFNENNNLDWVPIHGLTDAFNGLSVENNQVVLGGALTRNTSLSGDFTFTLDTLSKNLDIKNTNCRLLMTPFGVTLSTIGNTNITAASLKLEGSSTNSKLEIGVSGANKFHDDLNNKGLEYAGDYSGNFTEESLITKRYVDQEVSNSPKPFIKTYEVVTTVHSGGSTLSIPHLINLGVKSRTYFYLNFTGNPSTDNYMYSYAVNIDVTSAAVGDYVILDFNNNYGSSSISLNGTLYKLLSQNATYIVSWNGVELVLNKIAEGAPRQQRGTFMDVWGPGEYYTNNSSIDLPPLANMVIGEKIIIHTGGPTAVVGVPDGSDNINTDFYDAGIGVKHTCVFTVTQHDAGGIQWLQSL